MITASWFVIAFVSWTWDMSFVNTPLFLAMGRTLFLLSLVNGIWVGLAKE